MTSSNDVQLAVKRLRQNPADAKALETVLAFAETFKQQYFLPGEYFELQVPGRGRAIRRLTSHLGPCSGSCPARGCPGVLQFDDGTEACPYPDYGHPIRRALPDSTTVAVHKIEQLLREGKSKAKVELVDGRWVHFTVKKPKASVEQPNTIP
jgi:hypothetical protein